MSEDLDRFKKCAIEVLAVDEAQLTLEASFADDLDADSLDLYELVMKLEDTYGVSVSEEEAARIETVTDAVEFVLERQPA